MAGETCLVCRHGLYPGRDPECALTFACESCGHQANAFYTRAEYKRLIIARNEVASFYQAKIDSIKSVVDDVIAGFSIAELRAYRDSAHYSGDAFAGWNLQKLDTARRLTQMTKK